MPAVLAVEGKPQICCDMLSQVKNPATGEVIATVPCMKANETSAAVAEATSAWPEWSKKVAKERSKIMRKYAILRDCKTLHAAQAHVPHLLVSMGHANDMLIYLHCTLNCYSLPVESGRLLSSPLPLAAAISVSIGCLHVMQL